MPIPRGPRELSKPFGHVRKHESDPALMRKIIFEDQTRLLIR